MREWLIVITENAVVVIDALAFAVIAVGTIEAAVAGLRSIFAPSSGYLLRALWLRYARWLVAGLTFQLAADIMETAVTTDWDAVGRLAAIAVIRTFLNYFLESDVADIAEHQRRSAKRNDGTAPE